MEISHNPVPRNLPDDSLTGGRCKVCHNISGNRQIAAREMMFGYRDAFTYIECAGCGCVQIAEVPPNLARYYPADYFPEPASHAGQPRLKEFLRRQRAAYCLKGSNVLGRILTSVHGRPAAPIFGRPDYYDWLARCGVDFTSKILDIGCGLGTLLFALQRDGFSNLTGIDPYIEKPIASAGVRILKQEIYEIEEQFDLVMLHHTFEHMSEPQRVLRHINKLLRPGSHALIRIPVAGGYAYRKYGAHWAQLDAPRHIFLHTTRSMQLLADQAGLTLRDVRFDSTEFQFWASEQYLKDIPLRDQRSYGVAPETSIFRPEEIAAFKQRAVELNAAKDGDSACFYLFKP